jgi:uncharacterized protein YndB with AHSA1/START domain
MIAPDPSAPVFETAAIDVQAPAETVWDTLTDVDSWPQWMPGVRSVVTHGPFGVGSKFEWRAGPGLIRSEVVTAERPHIAGWRGRTFGISAVHTWRIQPPAGSASSHVDSSEAWSGLLPLLLRGMMRKAVRRALDEGLPALKAEAERRSRP